jgi:penicillin-binding protein 1A
MPDWQLEPDEEAWGFNVEGAAPLVDADGNPIGSQPVDPLAPEAQPQPQPPQEETQQWLDEVLRRNPDSRPPQQQPPRPQPSEPPPDPLQPRP